MSSAHNTTSWWSLTKQLRPVYQAMQNRGELVCGRCGQLIIGEFDCGHIVDSATALASGWPESAINSPDNVRPEHRTAVPGCSGNRAAGGRLSQAMSANAKAGQDLRHWTY